MEAGWRRDGACCFEEVVGRAPVRSPLLARLVTRASSRSPSNVCLFVLTTCVHSRSLGNPVTGMVDLAADSALQRSRQLAGAAGEGRGRALLGAASNGGMGARD